MRTHLRYRLAIMLSQIAIVITAAIVSSAGTAAAEQYCPTGSNWDTVTQSCR